MSNSNLKNINNFSNNNTNFDLLYFNQNWGQNNMIFLDFLESNNSGSFSLNNNNNTSVHFKKSITSSSGSTVSYYSLSGTSPKATYVTYSNYNISLHPNYYW